MLYVQRKIDIINLHEEKKYANGHRRGCDDIPLKKLKIDERKRSTIFYYCKNRGNSARNTNCKMADFIIFINLRSYLSTTIKKKIVHCSCAFCNFLLIQRACSEE